MSVPHADADLTVLWVIAELAPWALAAYVLLLLIPLLRGAERGEPFWDEAAGDLAQVGACLLVGIPAIALLRFVVGNMATSAVTFMSPIAEPHLLLTPWHVLPGLLVLALASVFRRGAALRDLERHTV